MVRRQAAADADPGNPGQGPLRTMSIARIAFGRHLASQSAALLALVAMIACNASAHAQDARSLANDMIGQWELSTAGRDKTCVVTLKGDTTPQGLKLELDKGCGDALPF